MNGSNASSGGVQTFLTNWIQKPFSEDMDAVHWALFFAFALITTALWKKVVSLILDNA